MPTHADVSGPVKIMLRTRQEVQAVIHWSGRQPNGDDQLKKGRDRPAVIDHRIHCVIQGTGHAVAVVTAQFLLSRPLSSCVESYPGSGSRRPERVKVDEQRGKMVEEADYAPQIADSSSWESANMRGPQCRATTVAGE
jgi:hypothetical protein